MEESIAKLPGRVFCINAGIDTTWNTILRVLEEFELKTTLADKTHYSLTTAFAQADAARIRQLAKGRMFAGGRFTMKIQLEAVSPLYTKLAVVLQVRQEKLIGKSETILKSKGIFEKFFAFRVSQLALAQEFPELYDLRVGFELVPNVQRNLYKIGDVEENSPAGESGFRDGDWLIAIDGKPIDLNGDLFKILLEANPEKILKVKVERGDSEIEIPLWVVRIPENKEKIGVELSWDSGKHQFWISQVLPDSRAERAGLRASDIMLKEAGLSLNGWINYYRAMARVGSAPVEVEVERNGQPLSLVL